MQIFILAIARLNRFNDRSISKRPNDLGGQFFNFVFVVCVLAILQGNALGKDFLWRVKSPGATVYLLGSVHLLRGSDHPLPASFDAAFNAAQQVGFELDLDEATSPNVQSYFLRQASYPSGQNIRSAVPAATYQKLQSFAVAHGLPGGFFDPYRPWYVTAAIETFNGRDAGFQDSLGVDAYYFNAAKAAGKARIYFETATFQVDTLVAVAESEYVSQLPGQIDGGKQGIVELVDAWRAGDVSRLTQLVEAGRVESPDQYRRVFLNRNNDFVEKTKTLLSQSTTTLVIVGAGHLVGSDGVVNRLQTLGYDVVQLPGTPPGVGELMLDYAVSDGENIFFANGSSPVLAEGATATLKLAAPPSGDGALKLQWLKDGQVIAGATNASLSQSSLRAADAGTYQLRVESEFGSAISGAFGFTVVEVSPPTLEIHLSRFGGVSLILSGTTNAHYRIEYTDKLPGPWLALTNVTLLAPTTLTSSKTNEARYFRAFGTL